jgi:hypothetical protein
MSEPTLADPGTTPVGTEASTTGPQQTSEQTSTDTSSQDANGGRNPAWNNLLDKLPKEFHSMIEPDLREWDQNFTNKTQQVQSQYEPYKFLLEDNVSPENVQAGLQIMAMIEADPQAFHKQMAEFYKDQWGQGQEVSQEQSAEKDEATFSLDGEGDEFDVTKHPKFQELASNQEALATYLAQEIEAKKQAAADAEVAAEETRLKEKYGDFNQKFVYSYAIQNGVDLEDAVKAFSELTNEIRSAPRANDSAPSVFSPSGGVPSSQPKPGQLSDRETRRLVAEMAQRAHNQG